MDFSGGNNALKGYIHRFHIFALLFSVLLHMLLSSINTKAASWDLSYTVIGLINFLGSLVYIFATLTLGHLGDRIGHKKMLMYDMLYFSVFMIMGYYWSEVWHLFVFSMGMNLFFGTFFPSLEGLLSSKEEAQGINPTAITTRFVISWSTGNVIGLAFGPYLIQNVPYVVFSFGIVLCIFSALSVWNHIGKYGEKIPGPFSKKLFGKSLSYDINKSKLYRRAYRTTFVLGGLIYTAVITLFPKLISMHNLALERTGFLVVGANLGVVLTFILLSINNIWIGKPKISFLFLSVFPITGIILFLQPSTFLFLIISLLAGASYAVPYTFAIFYGLHTAKKEHGKQGGFHEAMVGVIFGFGPLLGGLFLDLWSNLKSLGILVFVLFAIVLIVQISFVKKLSKDGNLVN
jgi:MFS family permease